MILVDSSVWIDYFNGRDKPQTHKLDELMGVEFLSIGDIILIAIKNADNFRILRKQGITIRKTNDVIIATFCLENDHSLLFSDKDFIPFVKYLGLNAVLIDT